MEAPNESLRPVARDFSVKTSPRPLARGQRQEESKEYRDEYASGLDVEMRADMDPLLVDDPIARLGYDPDRISFMDDRGMMQASYYPSKSFGPKADTVEYGPTTGASEDVVAHEFRHRGFSLLEEMYEQDPEGFAERYGREAATVLKAVGDELKTEFRDNPDAEWNLPFRDPKTGDVLKASMEETIDSFDDVDVLRKYVQTGELNTGSSRNDAIFTKGLEGLDKAATDILKERGEPDKAVKRDVSPGFFKRIIKSLGFAEGGMAMENQMRRAFMEEGGIADDGMDRDPVSGNEIPPGSLAEEVRDDIPAQLSEGEYVVPADVLRYYGVRFFEDLRSEAKQGLAQMEANGRIGGEPVPAGGPSDGDLTPDEMEALAAMGLNVGGFIPQQPAPQAVGNLMQRRADGYNEGGLEDGMGNTSGITSPANTQQSLQQQFPLGFSIFGADEPDQSGVTAQEFEVVNLYSPDGTMRSLTLPTDKQEYDRLISEGWTKEATGVTTETTVGMEDDRDGRPPFDPSDPFGNQSSEPTSESTDAPGVLGNIAANIAEFGVDVVTGAINATPLGLAMRAATGKTASELLGIESDDDGGDVSSGTAMFGGTGLFGDLDGDGTPNAFDFDDGSGPFDRNRGTGAATGSTSTTPTSSPRPPSRPDRDDNDSDQTGGTGATATGDEGDGTRGGSSPDTSTAAAEAAEAGFGDVESGEFGGMGSGVSPTGDDTAGTPFNAGGLASRPKKKRTTRKKRK